MVASQQSTAGCLELTEGGIFTDIGKFYLFQKNGCTNFSYAAGTYSSAGYREERISIEAVADLMYLKNAVRWVKKVDNDLSATADIRLVFFGPPPIFGIPSKKSLKNLVVKLG